MTDKGLANKSVPKVPTSEEFTRTVGQVTWLMTMSKAHRGKPISYIETYVSAPLMFKQVRVFLKGKQPIGALSWAYASDEVQAKLSAGDYQMTLQDWRSGPQVIVVDCISPFADPQIFIDEFMSQVAATKQSN